MLPPMCSWCFPRLACDESAQAARLGIAQSGGDVVQSHVRFLEEPTSRVEANFVDEIAIADSRGVESALKGADADLQRPGRAGDARITAR